MTGLPASKYFGKTEITNLLTIQRLRHQDRLRENQWEIDMENGSFSPQDALERYHIVLAQRLYRAQFFAFPAYTQEQLAYLVGCPTGSYLSMIMSRRRRPSRELAEQMNHYLRKLEMQEGMEPIYQPEYPE